MGAAAIEANNRVSSRKVLSMCPHCNGNLKWSGFLKVQCPGCKCTFDWSPIAWLMRVDKPGENCAAADDKIIEIPPANAE